MTTGSVRVPAAAGTFYPSRASGLTEAIDRLLEGATRWSGPRPWGIVVPHAGYRYSGPVAASGYATVRPWAASISRVVVLGPAHFVPLEGCAVPMSGVWRTPLGDVPVDPELRGLAGCAGCVSDDGPHAPEHAIGPRDACGADALRGAIAFARAAAKEIRLLDLRTSGDTAGDPERVVGYGAFAISSGRQPSSA